AAGRAFQPAAVVDDQYRGRRCAVARLVQTELGRWRVRGERRDDRATLREVSRRARSLRTDERLDEHVDRSAAREPHVPRLFVADPVPDDAAVPVAAGAL